MVGRLLPLLVALAAVAALAGVVDVVTRPPLVPERAEDTEFHADRALAALSAALGPLEPRPPGSPAHTRAREGLVRALEGMGATVDGQDELLHVGARALVRVRNVVGRLPGSGAAGPEAVALIAHYDSVASGPGAADDGAGLATLLEVARVQRGSMHRDLLLVFTDGEEAGLYGARAFVGALPRWGSIGAVINVEARGTRGPSLVFEVGPGVEPLLRGLPHPQSTSVAAEVYRRMPNDTDFSVLRDAGLTGFNLAFIEGWAGYHAPFDDLAALDARSVQHHGENAVALVRALDVAPAPRPTAADPVVFTDLFARWMVIFPAGWLADLSAVALLAALLPVVRGGAPGRAVVVAAARHLAGLTLGVILASVPGLVLGLVAPGGSPWHPEGGLVLGAALALGGVGMLLAAGGSSADPSSGGPGEGSEASPEPPANGIATAVALALLVVSGGYALSRVAPGAAHVLVLPGIVLAALASWGHRPAAATLGALALGTLLLPLARALPEVVGVGLPAVATLPLLLVLAPLVPLVQALPRPGRRALVATCAAAGGLATVVVAVSPPYDATLPGTTVARIEASGVRLVGQGRVGEVAGVPAAAIEAALPAPRHTCTRVGPAWEIEILPPVGAADVAVEVAGDARLAWGPHAAALAPGRWTFAGVGPEGLRLSLPGADAAALPVEVTRRGDLLGPLGVARGEDEHAEPDRARSQVPRGGGDRATWAGTVRCPSPEAGPTPTVRPGSERPPSAPRRRGRG